MPYPKTPAPEWVPTLQTTKTTSGWEDVDTGEVYIAVPGLLDSVNKIPYGIGITSGPGQQATTLAPTNIYFVEGDTASVFAYVQAATLTLKFVLPSDASAGQAVIYSSTLLGFSGSYTLLSGDITSGFATVVVPSPKTANLTVGVRTVVVTAKVTAIGAEKSATFTITVSATYSH